MKLLMIKPGPDIKTDKDYEDLKTYLYNSIRSGVCVTHPDVMTYEVVEFDSLDVDYPKKSDRKISYHRYLDEEYKRRRNHDNQTDNG